METIILTKKYAHNGIELNVNVRCKEITNNRGKVIKHDNSVTVFDIRLNSGIVLVSGSFDLSAHDAIDEWYYIDQDLQNIAIDLNADMFELKNTILELAEKVKTLQK